MNQPKRNLIVLLIALVLMMFFWINKIESPTLRIFGILMVSLTAYWVGRVHGKIVGIGADGKGPLMDPSNLY